MIFSHLESRLVNKVSDPVGKFWQTWMQALEPELGFSTRCASALTSLCLNLFCCEMDPLMEPVAGREDEMLSEPCACPVVKAVTIPSLS